MCPVHAAAGKPVSTQRCGRGAQSLERGHSREGCILQMGTVMGWVAAKEMALKKCTMAAVLPKHLDTGAGMREAIISQSPCA